MECRNVCGDDNYNCIKDMDDGGKVVTTFLIVVLIVFVLFGGLVFLYYFLWYKAIIKGISIVVPSIKKRVNKKSSR